MSDALVRTERDDGLVHIVLNQPERKNALGRPMMHALAAALDEIRDDKSVRAAILRGAGGVFSSGIDTSLLMEVFQESRTKPFRHLHRDLQAVVDRVEQMERPVIAVLSKYAVGMALELALACDFRIATADCVVGLPEVAFGIVPDVGGTTRLVRTVGLPKAKQYILTARLVRAGVALADGLVTEVKPDEASAVGAAEGLARQMARFPASAVGLAKTLVDRAGEVDAHTSRQLEGWVQSILLNDPEVGQSFPEALAYIKAQFAEPQEA